MSTLIPVGGIYFVVSLLRWFKLRSYVGSLDKK